VSRLRAERIPFIAPHNFGWLTSMGLFHARENPDNIHGALLTLLEDCDHVCHLSGFEQVGPTYRQLVRISRIVGMSEEQTLEWVALAESVPLSERHGLHILEKLGQQRAAA
jgi:hypothetical protein